MPKHLAEAYSGRKEFFGRRPPRVSNPKPESDLSDPSGAAGHLGTQSPAAPPPQESRITAKGRSPADSAAKDVLPRRPSKRAAAEESSAAAAAPAPKKGSLNPLAPSFVHPLSPPPAPEREASRKSPSPSKLRRSSIRQAKAKEAAAQAANPAANESDKESVERPPAQDTRTSASKLKRANRRASSAATLQDSISEAAAL